MSRGKKMARFAQNSQAENIIEPGKPLFEYMKGQWGKEFFKNNNPIVLELACGRGEYSTGLASHYPNKNFIGIDVKGDRIWKGSQLALKEGLKNVAFLRTFILELEKFFDEGEVDEIWLVFPDPRPRIRDAKRRLTAPRYLKLYSKIIKKNGLFRLKTDNTNLFEYSCHIAKLLGMENIVSTDNLYQNEDLLAEHHGITTRYEKEWNAKGMTIKYLKFTFPSELIQLTPEQEAESNAQDSEEEVL
ncbi:MAG: tRNA (guanosine(46)-N7)-methyltransferase TrmB [Cytophagales bacterium]|nr:MAG: tRNA (guanosine(46)-N7)-methyltransferase TrmB [Cytophagales bacterium]TAF60855.1 MAG: tRNA (guanosine(46)-N7)-methyltransferase TrmB [Cytophagales bacterium]